MLIAQANLESLSVITVGPQFRGVWGEDGAVRAFSRSSEVGVQLSFPIKHRRDAYFF